MRSVSCSNTSKADQFACRRIKGTYLKYYDLAQLYDLRCVPLFRLRGRCRPITMERLDLQKSSPRSIYIATGGEHGRIRLASRPKSCVGCPLCAERGRDGVTAINQEYWVDAALETFGQLFGGATAFPRAKGVWRDDERGGVLVKDQPVVLHCYTTPADITDPDRLSRLGSFCRRMGARRTKAK